MKKLILFSFLFTIQLVSISIAQKSWEKLNGPYGGRIDCMTIDEAGNLYAGMEFLYKSTNNGESWFKLELPPIQDFYWLKKIIASKEHIIISYWAGESDLWWGGVLESSDFGNSWYRSNYLSSFNAELKFNDNGDYLIAHGLQFGLYNLKTGNYFSVGRIDTNFGDVNSIIYDKNGFLLAGCENANWGIYRSTDFGMTWDSVGLKNKDVLSILLQDNGNILAGTMKGIWRSTDNGSTWDSVTLGNKMIYKVFEDSLKNYYACTDYDGIYKSVDGVHWKKTNFECSFSFGALVNEQGDIFTNNNHDGIWCLKKGASKWEEKNNGIDNLSAISMLVDKNNRIFAGTFGRGLYLSEDGGNTWKNILSKIYIYGDDIYSIATDSLGNMFVSTSNGVYRTTDSAKTWENVFESNNFESSVIKTDEKNNIYLVDDYRGVYQSTNHGDSWRNILNEHIVNSTFLTDKKGNLYVGKDYDYTIKDNGIYYSTNSGEFWTVLRNGINPESRNYSLIETSDGSLILNTSIGLYISDDEGQNWTMQRDSIWYLGSLVSNKNSVLFGSYYPHRIFTSLDKGKNWYQYLDTLPHLYYYMPYLDEGDNLYVLTSNGIFKSPVSTDVLEPDTKKNISDILNVFPNPFDNELTIIIKEHFNSKDLIITDLIGNQYKNVKAINTETGGQVKIILQTDELQAGIYFIQFKGNPETRIAVKTYK